MKVITTAFFTQPGTSFKVSHKVYVLIDEILTEYVTSNLFENIDDTFSFIINTKREQTTTEVRGPEYDRKNNMLTYGVCMPYSLSLENNFIETFIETYINAIAPIFIGKYNLEPITFKKVLKLLIDRIQQNPSDYIFSDELF